MASLPAYQATYYDRNRRAVLPFGRIVRREKEQGRKIAGRGEPCWRCACRADACACDR